jgi:hypothetical protein
MPRSKKKNPLKRFFRFLGRVLLPVPRTTIHLALQHIPLLVRSSARHFFGRLL